MKGEICERICLAVVEVIEKRQTSFGPQYSFFFAKHLEHGFKIVRQDACFEQFFFGHLIQQKSPNCCRATIRPKRATAGGLELARKMMIEIEVVINLPPLRLQVFKPVFGFDTFRNTFRYRSDCENCRAFRVAGDTPSVYFNHPKHGA